MTSGLPEKEQSATAPVRNRVLVLLTMMGVAVLAVSLVMAYREGTNTGAQTAAPAHDAVDAGNSKAAPVFGIYPQPRLLPTIRFTDEKVNAMTLQDFRGKFVLLNIWATWCPPCRKEMPTLDRLQARLGGPDFEVVALSIDRGGPFVVRSFYDEVDIQALRLFVDKSSDAMTDLGVNAIPATLLIDREGREIGRKIGPVEWDSPEIVKLISGYVALPVSRQPGKQ